MVVFIIFSGLDFDGRDSAVTNLNDKVYFSPFLAIEII
jgi:hypothetical protein